MPFSRPTYNNINQINVRATPIQFFAPTTSADLDFVFFPALAKLRTATISTVGSVRPSLRMNSSVRAGRIFIKFDIKLSTKSVKIQVLSKSDQRNWHSTRMTTSVTSVTMCAVDSNQ